MLDSLVITKNRQHVDTKLILDKSMNRMQQQYGIGLLELMLAMVIIAILTLMSIQYFSSSKRNTETTRVINEIQDILGIIAGFPDPVRIQGGFSDGQPNLNHAVIMSGTLPQEYIIDSETIGTPWKNGRINTFMHITGDGHASRVVAIDLSGVPNWACQSVTDRLRAEIFAFGGKTPDCTSRDSSHVIMYFLLLDNQSL